MLKVGGGYLQGEHRSGRARQRRRRKPRPNTNPESPNLLAGQSGQFLLPQTSPPVLWPSLSAEDPRHSPPLASLPLLWCLSGDGPHSGQGSSEVHEILTYNHQWILAAPRIKPKSPASLEVCKFSCKGPARPPSLAPACFSIPAATLPPNILADSASQLWS